MMKEFKHTELKLLNPSFDSKLVDTIIELNHLRKKDLGGTTPPEYFFELKSFFHMLESLGSARIEGNNTTITEYLESERENRTDDEGIKEIKNVISAMDFVDRNIVAKSKIDRAFVQEIHKIVVSGLDVNREGDRTPGSYRTVQNKISKSDLITPDYIQVDEYMEELFEFINKESDTKYDLIKTAIAHHRFTWIHPFANGNGRVVRLLTYAQLISNGFKVKQGRIINPAAVFYNDRKMYYRMLSVADIGTEENLLRWTEYLLEGLLAEIKKIDKLLDYKYLSKEILIPIINKLYEINVINDLESKILKLCVNEQLIKSNDLTKLMPDSHYMKRNRIIKKLIGKNLLKKVHENKKKYMISFKNVDFKRVLAEKLIRNNFIFDLDSFKGYKP